MRYLMLDSMLVLSNAIVADEAFAHDFADEASEADRQGDDATAALLRRMSRRHRIKVLEGNGQLSALRLRYAMLYD